MIESYHRAAPTLDMSDAASPEDAIRILRNIAMRFYEDAGELESAWQDKEAGKFWSRLARDLDRLADKADGYKP